MSNKEHQPIDQDKKKPRFLKEDYEQEKNIKDRFFEWTKQKIQYKSFRLQSLNNINKLNITHQEDKYKQNEELNMGYMEELFPLFIFNSMLITFFLNRRFSLYNKFFKTIGVGSFTYLMLVFYGEEQLFNRELMKSDAMLPYYLRNKFIETFTEQNEEEKSQGDQKKLLYYFNILNRAQLANENFEDRYLSKNNSSSYTDTNGQINEILKDIKKNNQQIK